MFSKWVDLTAGEYYYIETTLINVVGNAHLTVGMEIDTDDMPPEGHPFLETQVNRFSVGQTDLLRDTLEIRVTDPDGGTFALAFLVPHNDDIWASSEITAGCTADEMYDAIRGYYWNMFRVNPIVTLTTGTVEVETEETDEADDTGETDGAEDTEDTGETEEAAAPIGVYVYTVEVPKILTSASVETIMVAPITTQSSVTFVYPSERQLSSPPISGAFYIDCHHPDGNVYQTRDFGFGINGNRLRRFIEEDCSFLSGKISVSQLTSTYPDPNVGYEYEIHFKGLSQPVGLYEMKSSFSSPITGATIVYDAVQTRACCETI